MKTAEKSRKSSVKWIILAAVPAFLAVLFPILSPIRPFANFVTDWVSRPFKNLLGTVLSVLPFSFMEFEYIGAGIFLIWYLIRTAVLTCRAAGRFRVFARRILILLLVLFYIFVLFLWTFAIDYRSDSFTVKSGLKTGEVTPDELYAVTKYFLENAARAAGDVKRDRDGHWAEDMDGYIKSSTTLYAGLNREFDFLSADSRAPKKMYLFSRLSSWMGFTGVYFPYSGESNINIDAPGCLIPSTIAHELAHQKGVYAEQEANFVGIAACLASGQPVYIYSGYLSGAIHLSNALYSADPDAWYELSAIITGPMRTDWLDNSAYWQSFEGKVEEVSSKVYDGYLKAQGQPLGIRSYGACVDLLVAYYGDEAGIRYYSGD